ncbi:MAG TPA: ABC transporter substrate-binding protein [Mycobacteriales bacterium]|nr:ABC transporter substrate-binding protein [Mycobacteriales bacterium]
MIGRAGAIAAAVTAVAVSAACGARLTPAQTAELDRRAAVRPVITQTGVYAPVVAPAATAVAGPAPVGVPVATSAAAPGAGPVAPFATTGPTTAAPRGPASRAVTPPPHAGADTGDVSIDPKVCAAAADAPGVTATEVDLGNVSTLTGPIPGLFVGAVHGTQAFAAYLNSRGGICGRKVVVKAADDNLQVSQNEAATSSLKDSVFAFVGSFSGDDQGMPTALAGSDAVDIGEALATTRFRAPNNFSPEPIDGWNVAPYLLYKQLFPDAVKHMAILGVNQAAAVKAYRDEKAALLSAGYTFVYDDPNVEPTQTDFTADAQEMKAKGAQGVVFAAAELGAHLAKAVQDAGISPFPLGNYSSGAYDQAFLAKTGDAAEGITLEIAEAMYQGEDAQAVPMVATFNRWYRALYQQAPDEYAMYAWMSGLLLVDGLNRGGALTRAALQKGLGKVTQFDGGGMVATNDPAHKKPPTCYLIVDVQGGRFVRDPTDPPTGFNCRFAPSYYVSTG